MCKLLNPIPVLPGSSHPPTPLICHLGNSSTLRQHAKQQHSTLTGSPHAHLAFRYPSNCTGPTTFCLAETTKISALEPKLKTITTSCISKWRFCTNFCQSRTTSLLLCGGSPSYLLLGWFVVRRSLTSRFHRFFGTTSGARHWLYVSRISTTKHIIVSLGDDQESKYVSRQQRLGGFLSNN